MAEDRYSFKDPDGYAIFPVPNGDWTVGTSQELKIANSAYVEGRREESDKTQQVIEMVAAHPAADHATVLVIKELLAGRGHGDSFQSIVKAATND